jgi:hypothetical protein
MNDQNITCPKCGKDFPLSSTLVNQLNDTIRHDLEKHFELEKKEFIEKEKKEMWIKAQEKANEKMMLDMEDMKRKQEEQDKERKEMLQKELELRQKNRELEEINRKTHIEAERKIDEERKKIYEESRKESEESAKLKLAEKDKQLEQLNKTIQDLKRQSEQGSMQVQGDALETDLKQLLRMTFPLDDVADVPTGIKGADLIHTIKTNYGNTAGIILWECKNTKGFSQEWIKKLKDDQIPAKADLCILVTKTMPDNSSDFIDKDGVWIVENKHVLSLIHILRMHLMKISSVQQSMAGSDAKMQQLYTYIYSSEFTNKYKTIVRAFDSLKTELDQEKRAMQKIWSRREKEIERLIVNSSSIYGDLEGATGKKLPTIDELELVSGKEEIPEESQELIF